MTAQVSSQSGGRSPSVLQQNAGLNQAFARAVRGFQPSSAAGFQAEAPSQGYAAEFSNSGSLTLRAGKDRLGVKALAYGVGATRGALGAATASTGKDEAGWPKLTFARSGLTEWYVNGENGLHHWMQISERPSQSANHLWVRLGITGNAKLKSISDDAVEVRTAKSNFSYKGLKAWDARGVALDARLEVSGQEIAVVVNDASAKYPVTIDPTWAFQQKLTGTSTTIFGASVAISGDVAAVGAPSSNTNAGVVYLFSRSGNVWTAGTTPVTGAAGDLFGTSVAISGTTLAVGCPGSSPAAKGVVKVYIISGTGASIIGTAQDTTTLVGLNGSNDHVGDSVAISGNTIIAASGRVSGGKGGAFAYLRTGSTWAAQTGLSDGASPVLPSNAGNKLGTSVAIDGNNVLVGSPGNNTVYYATRSGSTWTLTQTLAASGSPTAVEFGTSVSLQGTTMVVGAPGTTTVGTNSGYAQVYTLSGTWSAQGSRLTPQTTIGSRIGQSVGVWGNFLVVGGPNNGTNALNVNNTATGKAYVYSRSAGTWTLDSTLQASDTAATDNFGAAVAIDDHSVIAGLPNKTSNAGAAYVFTTPKTATVSFSPTSVVGGTGSTGTITLDQPVLSDTVFSLSSNDAAVTVPATVTVLANASTATFSATTVAVGADVTASVTPSLTGYTGTAGSLTVTAPTLSSVSLTPTTVIGGNSSAGTVTISSAAPVGGLVVNLASNSASMTVPATVTVLAGNTTVGFTANTTSVVAQTIATVTASRSGSTDKTANLTINPNKILTFTHPSNFMLSGHTERFKINVNTVQASDVVVTLTSSNPNVVVPPTATVKAGSLFATFYATVANVPTNETTDLTGTSTNWVTATKTVTLYAPRTASVKFAKTSVAYGNTVRGTVRLDAVAPTGGFVVTLNSNNAALTVPATVTVAAGKYSVGFVATANAVAASTPVTVTATPHRANPVTGSVTVEPYSKIASVSLNHPVLLLGATATGTVHLTSNAPAGGQTVNLTYSAGVTGVASVVVPAGTKTANFSVTCTSGNAQQGLITASNGLDSKKTTIQFVVPKLSTVVLDSASVTGGNASGVTVTLAAAAPWPGVTVNLASTNAAASTAAASVFIAEGTTSGHVGITTTSVGATTKAKINANVSISTVVKYAVLTINP